MITLSSAASHFEAALRVGLPELSVVLPAFNERGNVVAVLEALRSTLADIRYEVVLVDDDSEDGTADLARSLTQQFPELRVIQRINRYGLASACIEGMMASHAPYLAVMDCDLQHDEKILPQMLERLRTEDLDIVIGTRHAEGGSTGDFAAPRRAIGDTGRLLSRAVYRENISDPMIGFFILDRRFLLPVVRSLSGTGYKILLDLLVSLEYLELLVDKITADSTKPWRCLPASLWVLCGTTS